MPGTETNLAIPFRPALMTFFTPSRLASYGVRCQAICMTGPCLSCTSRLQGLAPRSRSATVAGACLSCRFLLAERGCRGFFPAGSVSEACPKTDFRPLPSWVLALQGFPLFRSFSAASGRLPSIRFDGLKVLALPGRVGWLSSRLRILRGSKGESFRWLVN